MRKFVLAAALGALTVTASSSYANRRSNPIRYYSDEEIAKFDVLGIRLRMSPNEVVRILISKGYRGPEKFAIPRVTSEQRPCDFKWKVEAEIRKRTSKEFVGCSWINPLEATSDNGRISVAFKPDNSNPSGLSVANVELVFGNVAREELKQSIFAKYGDPTSGGPGVGFFTSYHWAVKLGTKGFHPSLRFSIPDALLDTQRAGTLTLDGYAWIDAMTNRAVELEADRIMPPKRADF